MTSNSTLTISPNELASHLLSSRENRYTTISIPSTYGHLHDSPAAGTIVGIVLGSVAGFVLLMYILFLAVNPGGLARGGSSGPAPTVSSSLSMDEEEIVEVRGSRRPSRRRRSDNTIEVMEERETFRDSYRRRPSSRHDRIVVEESLATSTSGGGDVVEVLEEESSVPSDMSPRPPRRSRRGVSHVDPLAYGGGSQYSRRS